MTSLADKLEKEGLATRKPGKNGDRRNIRIALTEQGQHLRCQVIESHDSLLNKVLERFSNEHLCELRRLLRTLNNELQSQLENDGLLEDETMSQ